MHPTMTLEAACDLARQVQQTRWWTVMSITRSNLDYVIHAWHGKENRAVLLSCPQDWEREQFPPLAAVQPGE